MTHGQRQRWPEARRGWFSDVGSNEDDKPTYRKMWQPCLELGGGFVPCIDVWFATEAECDSFIKAEILGQPFLESTPLPGSDEVAGLIASDVKYSAAFEAWNNAW